MFQILNYQGQARVVVQLVTALTQVPQLHAHSLVGKQCDKGICIADLQSKDSSIRSASQTPADRGWGQEVAPPPATWFCSHWTHVAHWGSVSI